MVALPIQHNPTIDAIYQGYEAVPQDDRWYLGMSTLGTECDRALWYTFRQISKPEKFSGRMLRLFETGHREEDRMLDNLERAGVKVERVDPVSDKQWASSSIMGHFRGHADGIGVGFLEAPKTPHLIECKTHSEKSFKDVVTKGVQLSKPGHYAQMQMYMHHLGLVRAFYMAHNKNTDELYSERIAYDPVIAGQLMARAERIITAQAPPAKLHENPESKMAFTCKFCPHFSVCHEGAMPRQHCRSCLSSTPVEGGFHCDVFKQVNDIHMQKMGCSQHLFIPALVPGEQVDADIENRTVTYRMRDGSTYVDGQQIAPVAGPPKGGGGPLTDETIDAVSQETSQGVIAIAVKSIDPPLFSDEVQ
jgi:hypothetical protein